MAVNIFLVGNIRSFPMQFDPDSFVSIVTTKASERNDANRNQNELTELLLLQSKSDPPTQEVRISSRRQSVTFTIFEVDKFRFGLELDEEERTIVGNLSTDISFIRFVQKFKRFKTLFILLTESFNETINGIQNSGYATSHQVLFFVRVNKLSSHDVVIMQFRNGLFASEDIKPFSAPLLFFKTENSQIILFRYFAYSNSEALQIITNQSQLSHLSLLSTAQQRHGHQMTIKLITNNFVEEIPTDLSLSERMLLYYHLRYTGVPEIWVMYKILHNLNISSVARSLDEPAMIKSKWLLDFYAGERAPTGVPNVIAHTRGLYAITGEVHWKIISCVAINSMNKFDHGITSVFETQICIQIILVGLLLSILYRSLHRGMDIIWLFLGWGCELHHPRNVMCYILIPISIVAYTYSAYISTELMKLAKFPSGKQLFADGYKLWLRSEVITLITALLKDSSKILKVSLSNLIGGKKLWDVAHGDAPLNALDMLKLFITIADKKLMLLGYSHMDLVRMFGNSQKYVQRKLMCKVINLCGEVEGSKEFRTLRVWGYLSPALTKLHSRSFQMGFFDQAEKSGDFHSQQQGSRLDLMDVEGFLTPEPMKFESAIGIFSLYLIAAHSLLFLIWILSRAFVRKIQHCTHKCANLSV